MKTIEAEEKVRLQLQKAWAGIKLTPFPNLCEVDWFAERNDQLVGIIELKCRNVSSLDYPTILIAERKKKAMEKIAGAFGVPPLFVVRYTDAIMYVDVREVDGEIRDGGNPNHPTPYRIEPCFFWPVSKLKKVAVP